MIEIQVGRWQFKKKSSAGHRFTSTSESIQELTVACEPELTTIQVYSKPISSAEAELSSIFNLLATRRGKMGCGPSRPAYGYNNGYGYSGTYYAPRPHHRHQVPLSMRPHFSVGSSNGYARHHKHRQHYVPGSNIPMGFHVGRTHHHRVW